MHFLISTSGSKLTIRVANDGNTVPKGIVNSMFELGISGSGGSGIGLYTCSEIVKGMGGGIQFNGHDPILGGAVFEINFFQ